MLPYTHVSLNILTWSHLEKKEAQFCSSENQISITLITIS